LLFLLSSQPFHSTTLSATAVTLLHIAGFLAPPSLQHLSLYSSFSPLPSLVGPSSSAPHSRVYLLHLPPFSVRQSHTPYSPLVPIPSTFFALPSPPIFVVDTHGHALPLAPTLIRITLVPSVNATDRTPNSPPPQAPSPALSPPWDGSLTPPNHPKRNTTTTTLQLPPNPHSNPTLPQLNVRTPHSPLLTRKRALLCLPLIQNRLLLPPPSNAHFKPTLSQPNAPTPHPPPPLAPSLFPLILAPLSLATAPLLTTLSTFPPASSLHVAPPAHTTT
jgi:hypothetical protein